ncbi:hypothetical protein IV203_015931 [Nitzschia inconspicua]|uniref:Uncharacterized protein n=1 Tax=Nitzschia inconspicua TaxID=303405 RepID=A0A9K3K4V8_9STRA|nr:hypothetical protein IV203_025042 [Nitzschia inconspicua]KAG7359342.1 hypothetical protein IV203_015931 [Nitzschia inconspicua]
MNNNSWNHRQSTLQAALASSTSIPSQSLLASTTNPEGLQGLLSLLKHNQDGGGNLADLITLLVNNNNSNNNINSNNPTNNINSNTIHAAAAQHNPFNMVQSHHHPTQPHPSLPLLHPSLMPMSSFHSVATTSHHPSPSLLPQVPSMGDHQLNISSSNSGSLHFGVPTQSQDDFLRNASNRELEAMIQHLQKKVGPHQSLSNPLGDAAAAAEAVMASTTTATATASRPVSQTDHHAVTAASSSPSVDSKPSSKHSKHPATVPSSHGTGTSGKKSTTTTTTNNNHNNHAKVVAGPNMAPPPQPIAGRTKGKEILLYRDIDEFYLTEYQCLLRQQIELFEATNEDLQASAQGRNSPIQIGQVGIRCKYCATVPIKCRSRGAVYFPRSIDGIYQVAQNLTKIHLCGSCTRVPQNLRKKLAELSTVNKRASGGKRYWIERVREIGIYEDGKAIRFKKDTSSASSSSASS